MFLSGYMIGLASASKMVYTEKGKVRVWTSEHSLPVRQQSPGFRLLSPEMQ